nr:hypothetical protein [Tanacetum cinerariifolium]
IKFEGLHAFNTPCKTFAIHPRDHDNPYDDAHPEEENSLKRQNTFKHGTYVFGESSSGPEKIVLSLHKFPVVIFLDDDIEERTSRWVEKFFIRSIVIWEGVHEFQLGVESYQQKVNLTAPTITFPVIEKHKMFPIVSESVYGIIYKNSKKEKRHGYVTPSLSKEDAEYLQLFKEETEEWLKHRDQIRRWEMYVNERPLGSRRER